MLTRWTQTQGLDVRACTYRWTHFSKHLVTPSLARKVVKPLFCNVQREGDLCDLTMSCFRPSQQRSIIKDDMAILLHGLLSKMLGGGVEGWMDIQYPFDY